VGDIGRELEIIEVEELPDEFDVPVEPAVPAVPVTVPAAPVPVPA
jgi:hypothetical protein